MIKIKYFNEQFSIIESNNKLFLDIIKNSPSRIYLNGHILYPISELFDIFEYSKIVCDNYEIDEQTADNFNKFKKKIELLTKLKNGDISGFNLTNPPNFIGELLDRQKPVILQILLMQRYLLALEVGMGKTVISLFVILKLRELQPIKALIICECNQIHKTWVQTILTFSNIKDFVVVNGSKEQREKQKEKLKDHWLCVTSYDVLRIDKNFPKDWDIIVMDEITKIKNISTKTAKEIYNLKATYKIGLSGTPIVNSYLDLYGIMKAINPNIFTTKANFLSNYIKLDFFGRPIGLLEGAETELKRKIYPWSLQQTKSEFNMTKPIHIITIPVELTSLQKKILNEIDEQLKNGTKTAFECQTILRQICNTVKIIDEYKNYDLDSTTNKVSELKKLLHDIIDIKNKKVIVFSFFKTVVDLLEEELKNTYKVRVVSGESKKTCRNIKELKCDKCLFFDKCVSVKKYIYEFVEMDVQLLLGTDSLSRSHDLYTCDTIINFDLPWTAADLIQRFGRIDRGEKNKAKEFFIYNLSSLGTIEEKIIKKIEVKSKESHKVFPKYSVSLSRLSSTIKVK